MNFNHQERKTSCSLIDLNLKTKIKRYDQLLRKVIRQQDYINNFVLQAIQQSKITTCFTKKKLQFR